MTDRFELLSELGAGGMGAVWKARDAETGEVVALKLVHAHLAKDPDYVARFEREVEVAQRIDSPNVVKVLGYGTREGVPFMAMEYVEGQSLREVLAERGKLSWDEAKPIVRQVADGLGAAHAAGVIHRDVKPSNVLITQDGTAKLADFGIARALDMTRLTGSSTMLGTPHYMAPDHEVTPQSDIYSLGCVLYEMLTGRPPFDGETPQEVWRAHDRDTIQVMTLPREAGLFVAWMTRRDPNQRPRSATELAEALASGEAGRVPGGAGGRRRRTVVGAIASGVAALALAAVTTALMLGGGDDEPKASAPFDLTPFPPAIRTPAAMRTLVITPSSTLETAGASPAPTEHLPLATTQSSVATSQPVNASTPARAATPTGNATQPATAIAPATPTATQTSAPKITIGQEISNSTARLGARSDGTNVSQGQSFTLPAHGVVESFAVLISNSGYGTSHDRFDCSLLNANGNTLAVASAPGFDLEVTGTATTRWVVCAFTSRPILAPGMYMVGVSVRTGGHFGYNGNADGSSYAGGTRRSYIDPNGYWFDDEWDSTFVVTLTDR